MDDKSVTPRGYQFDEKEMHKMSARLDAVYYALVGNEMTKDGGLIKRISDVERENELLKSDIQVLKDSNIKGQIYVKWLWAACSGVASLIFTIVVEHVFKK